MVIPEEVNMQTQKVTREQMGPFFLTLKMAKQTKEKGFETTSNVRWVGRIIQTAPVNT